MGCWNRPYNPLSIPYLLNWCQGLAGECGHSAPSGEGMGSQQYVDQIGHCCTRSQQTIVVSIIHMTCAGQHPSESKWPKMPTCRANQWASSPASEKLVEGCPGHLVQQQSGHSTCWYPPPSRQAAHPGRVSKKSRMQRSLTHGSAGHADE